MDASTMTWDEDTSIADLHWACQRFLFKEAETLDDHRLSAWLDLLAEDIKYQVPIRVTRERSAPTEFSEQGFHFNEDWTSLQARVERLESHYDWSENPPSRTRRFVTNVRLDPQSIDSEAKEVAVRNYLLLYRSKGNTTAIDWLAGDRHDSLQMVDGDWQLTDRRVLLDQTIVGTEALPIFL